MKPRLLNIVIYLAILPLGMLTGCKKYLDKKPDKQLVVPSTLKDLQALLDYSNKMNLYVNNGIGEASADNYYLTAADWAAFSRQDSKSTYIWDEEIFYDYFPNDWVNLFSVVYTTNVILESIGSISQTTENSSDWSNVAGSAYFYRAQSHLTVTTNFCKAYNPATAQTDMGIPLRLTTDFNQVSTRSNLEQSYDQILNDLTRAAKLLPVTPQHVMRPSKPAAFALLSRTYLSMGLYQQAGNYADSALQLFSWLLDYNTINPAATLPFSQFNAEVIFHATGSHGILQLSKAKMDSSLYLSYHPNDIRKAAFFTNNNNGSYGFKGNYTGVNSVMFVGIAADELYLTKAECLAREGKTQDAMAMLNSLLIKRWKTGTFIAMTSSTSTEALQKILVERRKQLVMRDLRWMDIKRLNRENAGIHLTRNLNGQTYSLAPNDNRFALPFPRKVLNISGMSQNPR